MSKTTNKNGISLEQIDNKCPRCNTELDEFKDNKTYCYNCHEFWSIKELFDAKQYNSVLNFDENIKCGYCEKTAKELGCRTDYIMKHHVHACKSYGVYSE